MEIPHLTEILTNIQTHETLLGYHQYFMLFQNIFVSQTKQTKMIRMNNNNEIYIKQQYRILVGSWNLLNFE